MKIYLQMEGEELVELVPLGTYDELPVRPNADEWAERWQHEEHARNKLFQQFQAMRDALKETSAALTQISNAYDGRFFRAGQWADKILATIKPLLP